MQPAEGSTISAESASRQNPLRVLDRTRERTGIHALHEGTNAMLDAFAASLDQFDHRGF